MYMWAVSKLTQLATEGLLASLSNMCPALALNHHFSDTLKANQFNKTPPSPKHTHIHTRMHTLSCGFHNWQANSWMYRCLAGLCCWSGKERNGEERKSITKTYIPEIKTPQSPGEVIKAGSKCLSAAIHIAPQLCRLRNSARLALQGAVVSQSTSNQTSNPEVSQEHGRESEFSHQWNIMEVSWVREAYKDLGLVVVKRECHSRR